VIGRAVLDMSAWFRLSSSALSSARRRELTTAIGYGRIFGSVLLLLESGYAARDAAEHSETFEDLLSMPQLEIDVDVEARALDAQRQMARQGQHRVPPADVLTSALADRHGVAVLHYDHHFDLIAERTDLVYDSIWLAEPGSL
jgi:predicted nucleic acid-binding protein